MTGHRSCLLALVLAVCTTACDKKDEKAAADPATPAAATAATSTVQHPAGHAGAAAAAATAAGGAAGASGNHAAAGTTLKASKGKMSFLIDAPLEKIKGQAEEVQGHISLDPNDLSKTRGELGFKLTSLVTRTFDKPDKDASQTDHARNWMEVGPESSAEKKAEHAWSKFTVKSVEGTPAKLADVKEENGVRTVKGKVTGDLMMHGITTPKTFAFTALIKGPVDAPTEVTIKTDAPVDVSMKAYQIMPRDKLGGILSGALEKIGQKIDDRVQVSLEMTATK